MDGALNNVQAPAHRSRVATSPTWTSVRKALQKSVRWRFITEGSSPPSSLTVLRRPEEIDSRGTACVLSARELREFPFLFLQSLIFCLLFISLRLISTHGKRRQRKEGHEKKGRRQCPFRANESERDRSASRRGPFLSRARDDGLNAMHKTLRGACH